MILGGDHTNFYGLKQALGEADSYHDGASAREYYMNDDALVLDRVASLPEWDQQPVMFQFHLMSAHGLGTRHEAPQFQPEANFYGINGRTVVRSGGPDRAATNYYDNGVAQFDRVVSKIIEILKRKKYLDNALVVITGDHGEMLGEHGLFAHAKTVYNSVLRVPFIMLRFGYESQQRIDPNVTASQVDIAPTVLTELEMPIPSTWSGHPMQFRAPRDFIFFQQGAEVGLLDIRIPDRIWKYWLDFNTSKEFAFDVTNDPHETANLINAIANERMFDWRRQIMSAGSAVILQE